MTVIETVDFCRDLLNEPLDSTRTFPDDSSSFYKDTTLLGYFNREQQVVQQVLIQSFENYFITSTSIDTVNNQEEYTMATSVMKILRMEWIGNGTGSDPIEIFPMSVNEKEYYQGLRIGVTSVGSVRTYAIKGRSFIFRPKPQTTQNSAIKYYFVQRLSDLSSGTSTSLVPPQYHEAIGWGIYKRALVQEEASVESITVALSEYNRLISEMRLSAENRQIQKPRFVKRRKFRGTR